MWKKLILTKKEGKIYSEKINALNYSLMGGLISGIIIFSYQIFVSQNKILWGLITAVCAGIYLYWHTARSIKEGIIRGRKK